MNKKAVPVRYAAVKQLQKSAQGILANVNHLVKDLDTEYLAAIIETCAYLLGESNHVHPAMTRIASIIKTTHKPVCDCAACKFLKPPAK